MYSRVQRLGEKKYAKEKTLKVLNSGVDMDYLSKGAHVRRSTCSGVRSSRELECASVKSSEVKEQK
jgi:hypothetical protein